MCNINLTMWRDDIVNVLEVWIGPPVGFFTSEKVPGVFQIIQIIPRGMQTIEDKAMNQPMP